MRTLPALLAVALAGCAHASPAPLSFAVHVSGRGRPVVLITDLAAPGRVWQGTVDHLAGRAETHVLEVAGFAGNPSAQGPLLPALRAELADYVRTRKLDRPVIVGHLFGATVAYWLAMTEPGLLGGVIAIDAPPSRATGDPQEEAQARAGAKALAEATPERFAQMMRRRLASSMKDQALAARLGRMVARSDQAAVAEAFLDMMTRDLRSEISAIRVPVLALLTTGNLPEGAAPLVEQTYRQQLAQVPSHRLVVVHDSRHYVMFDQPRAIHSELDRFLAEHR